MLLEPTALQIVRGYLEPEDCAGPYARAALEAAFRLEAEGKRVDPVLVAAAMAGDEGANRAYLAQCLELTPTAANVEEYCKLAQQESMERRLCGLAEELQRDAREGTPWTEAAGEALQKLRQLLEDRGKTDLLSGCDQARSFQAYRKQVVADRESLVCSTGFSDLDRCLGGGLFRGGMYVVGGRPGMGKTTLGVAIAENVSRRGKRVLFVSLEMSDHQLTAKRIARLARIGYTKLLSGPLDGDERDRAGKCLGRIAQTNLYLNRRYGLTGEDIAALARRLDPVDLIVVDHLGLVRGKGRSGGRYEAMTEVSNRIKQLALSLEAPVLALCQLNRANTDRQDKRPMLSDLRDTGAIEQDADAVVLLHREAYYRLRPGERNAGDEIVECIVAKNRHGYTGTVEMLWDGEFGTIEQLARVGEAPF